MAERDVSFWIPVVAGRRLGGVFLPEGPRLSWFLPYIWVDNAIAMTAGREVFGFPKQTSNIQLSGTDPECFSVQADVIRRYGSERSVEPAPLINVRRAAPPAPDAARRPPASPIDLRAWLSNPGGVASLGLRSGLSRLANAIVRDLTQPTVSLVFLKQFRDIVDPTRACYQAIVEADASCTAIRSGSLLCAADYRVELSSYDSHPLIADLGLGSESNVCLEPSHAFWLDFDFRMELGRVIERGVEP